ncbi:MAG: amidohydrolase family protein [Victivallales bacterium]
MLDLHVHITTKIIRKTDFINKLEVIGAGEAVLLSLPPGSFFNAKGKDPFHERLNNVLKWCDGVKSLHPFFWIDPLADDAANQVDTACGKGIAGFKVICDRFYPSDDKAMKIFKLIARRAKPILFHSGILWDGKVSSKYNHPMEFECLLELPKLRFALAHVSWPWCDELLAVYGKFLNALSLKPEDSPEMFIDTTPGTPAIYREETLKKLYTIGYDIQNNIVFGSDSNAAEYNLKWVREWYCRDRKILRKLKLNDAAIEKYFSGNAKRFLGTDRSVLNKKCPVPGAN